MNVTSKGEESGRRERWEEEIRKKREGRRE
jgi:hypothetical protein